MDEGSLLDKLDPSRDYGDRTYDEVVEAVKSGELALSPGQTLPIIRDARTNKVVPGTGRPPGKGQHAAFNRAFIQEQFSNNAEEIWKAAFIGATTGHGDEAPDPRWAKLLFEYGIGAPLQDKGNEAGASEFMKVLAALAERKTAVPREEYIEGEFSE